MCSSSTWFAHTRPLVACHQPLQKAVEYILSGSIAAPSSGGSGQAAGGGAGGASGDGGGRKLVDDAEMSDATASAGDADGSAP